MLNLAHAQEASFVLSCMMYLLLPVFFSFLALSADVHVIANSIKDVYEEHKYIVNKFGTGQCKFKFRPLRTGVLKNIKRIKSIPLRLSSCNATIFITFDYENFPFVVVVFLITYTFYATDL